MKCQSTIAFKTRKTSTTCSLVTPHLSIPKRNSKRQTWSWMLQHIRGQKEQQNFVSGLESSLILGHLRVGQQPDYLLHPHWIQYVHQVFSIEARTSPMPIQLHDEFCTIYKHNPCNQRLEFGIQAKLCTPPTSFQQKQRRSSFHLPCICLY